MCTVWPTHPHGQQAMYIKTVTVANEYNAIGNNNIRNLLSPALVIVGSSTLSAEVGEK